jgi:hypothetical protein
MKRNIGTRIDFERALLEIPYSLMEAKSVISGNAQLPFETNEHDSARFPSVDNNDRKFKEGSTCDLDSNFSLVSIRTTQLLLLAVNHHISWRSLPTAGSSSRQQQAK